MAPKAWSSRFRTVNFASSSPALVTLTALKKLRYSHSPPVSGLYGVYKEKGLISGTLKSQLAADAYGDVLQLYQGAYDLPPELDTTVS